MVDKNENIERLIIISGHIGRAMVFIGMVCGCILLWTLIIRMIMKI